MASNAPDANAVKAQQREFIRKLFESDFGVSILEITTLPRCNNNFLHFVTFPSPIALDLAVSNKSGTDPIPRGTTKVVFRIGNPASMFNHAVKVENTVAMMQLARQALSDLAIVPHVYAWNKSGGPSGNGWILEQHMPGIDIESKFHHSLSRESQRHILSQIAKVLKMVQDFRLPAKALSFGGLAFDENGNIISGPFVVEPYTGPYPDMKSYYRDMLRVQLQEADRSRVANGWRQNELRGRLDAFAERGLEGVLSRTLGKQVKPGLIIGDIVIANFLFHPTTHQILGLVDYDCSHTGYSLHEFFFSSFSVSYYVLADDPLITSALFRGFPSPLPPSMPPTSPGYRDNDTPQWEVMKMFEEELERVGATRPSSVEGAEEITNVYKLLSEVCPFHFLMERWIERQSEEKLQEHIKKQWSIIDKGLAEWGF